MGRLILVVAAYLFGGAVRGANSGGPAERRDALLKAALGGGVEEVGRGLSDENLVVRRTAARLLAEAGASAEGALATALGNTDSLVRRTALRALCRLRPERALDWARKGLGDEDPAVRRVAVDWLTGVEPRTDNVTALLVKARGDGDALIRDAASAALFPFQRENVSLRNRKDYDHDVRIAQAIPLPESGWEFRLDPGDEGHLKGWFSGGGPGWARIDVGKTWESQGHAYDGVAWYRLTFKLPSKPGKLTAVDLAFDGVDEAAWVWLNGEYIGSHDMGKAGWNKAFQLDITREIRWGGENVLVVRVFDSAAAGGIWRPVRVEVLE